MLKDTLIVMIFFFTVVAIASFQVFNGKLKQRCFSPKTGICNNEYSDNYLNCKQDSDCNPDEICGKIIKNPNNDALNYDTFLYSLIQVYQTTTLEGWTEQMQDLQNTMDKYLWLYSFALVFFGSLIIINLVLAVVTIRFV
jgi:hypothetical protein